MTDVDEQGRPEPPLATDETTTLIGFLDYQRATLAWKCAGLDAEGLNAQLPPTDMTLAGLLNHMAYVEDSWFSRWLYDNKRQPPWDTVDWTNTPDWDWHQARNNPPHEPRTRWNDAVPRSRDLLTKALTTGGLDRPTARSWPDGRAPSLRWVLCHMIEEYARHNGHADILRQSVDGETGE